MGGDRDSGGGGRSCVLGGENGTGTVSEGSSRLRRTAPEGIVLVLLDLSQCCRCSEEEGGGEGEGERVEGDGDVDGMVVAVMTVGEAAATGGPWEPLEQRIGWGWGGGGAPGSRLQASAS